MSTQPRPTPVAVVAGSPADLDEVMATMAAAFDPRFGEAWTRGQCESILGLSDVWLLIARIGGEPAGFALARTVADEAELLLLAVTPPFRRRGVGAALLDATMAKASAGGGARLFLEMRDGNPASALYTGVGFAEQGRRRAYYRGQDGRAIDAITLSATLA